MKGHIMTQHQKDTFELKQIETIIALHRTINNPDNYKGRVILYRDFGPRLVEATREVKSQQSKAISSVDEITPSFVKGNLKKNNEDLNTFNNLLADRKGQNDMPSPLDVVERILLDFDILGLLHKRKNHIAQEYIKDFFPVLERSARYVVPFVLVQRALRGFPQYKEHYMQLLEHLKIINPDNGVRVKQ